jgi:hypothetical protein
MRRRTLAVSLAASAMFALAIAGEAQASADQAAACTVAGTATTDPDVQLVGGSGTYNFTSGTGVTPLQLNCLVTSGGKAAVQTLSVPSPGHYRNQVCGTGTADGTNGTITPTTVAGDATLAGLWTGVSLTYHIEFVGGVGTLTFIKDSIYGDPNSSATGTGPIDIAAVFDHGPNPGAASCTHTFQVNGALAGVLVPSPVSDSLLHPAGT